MRIGFIPVANIKKYRKQYISIHFFTLGLPLFPTNTYYVTERLERFEIPSLKAKVLHVYSRFYLIPAGIGLKVLGNNEFGFGENKNLVICYLLIALGLALIGLSIYSWAVWGGNTKEESLFRRVASQVFDYNLPPEYLSPELRQRFFTQLQIISKNEYGITDWKTQIQSGNVNKQNAKILYVLAYYNQVIHSGQSQAEQLFAGLRHKLQLDKKSVNK